MAKSKYSHDPDYAKPPRWADVYRKHCPERTCPMTRHAKLIADQILRDRNSPVRRWLIDNGYEPDHWATAIEGTVIGLWEARQHLEYKDGAWVPICGEGKR